MMFLWLFFKFTYFDRCNLGIKINNNNQHIKAREKMHSKSKQVHVGYDGTVYELNSYAETLKNHQTCSFLI